MKKKIPNHCGGTGPLPERSVQPGGFGGRLWHCCSNPACRSSADHLDKPENRTAGLDTDHGGKKYHSKSSCSGMKGPEKVSLSTAKQRGFTACKKCYR